MYAPKNSAEKVYFYTIDTRDVRVYMFLYVCKYKVIYGTHTTYKESNPIELPFCDARPAVWALDYVS